MTKSVLKIGQKVGDFTLIGRTRKGGKKTSPSIRKRWRVECSCGAKLTVPEMYLKRKGNPKTHCGCKNPKSLRSIYNNEYRIWLMVRERTRNEEHVAQKHYSARGIDICDEWYDLETGFELFFKDVGKRPSKNHTLDRIDNMRGYEPNNVRWATPSEQRANQGDKVSGYTEQQIRSAGFTREAFTTAIASGANAEKLINGTHGT
tara:strand:- start:157 stop:768 length:612 start_codon:yes stop_codon:yes gene_type:complete